MNEVLLGLVAVAGGLAAVWLADVLNGGGRQKRARASMLEHLDLAERFGPDTDLGVRFRARAEFDAIMYTKPRARPGFTIGEWVSAILATAGALGIAVAITVFDWKPGAFGFVLGAAIGALATIVGQTVDLFRADPELDALRKNLVEHGASLDELEERLHRYAQRRADEDDSDE